MIPDCVFKNITKNGITRWFLISDSYVLTPIGDLRIGSENVYHQLTDNSDVAKSVYGIYQSDIVSKKNPPSFKKWFSIAFDNYIEDGINILDEPPASISFNRNEPTFIYVDESKIQPGPHPSWDNFLAQCSNVDDQDIIKASIYKAFDPLNFSRQALYIYDTGHTGKSTVASVLLKNLPHMTGSFNWDSLNSPFGYADFEHKKLMIYPDCTHPGIIKSEKLHNVTGGDIVRIERKYQIPYTTSIHCHVIIMSNKSTVIDTYKEHERSRTLAIRLESSKCPDRGHFKDDKYVGNRNFGIQLNKEFWHFIHSCKIAYEKLCPTRCDIMIDPSHVSINASHIEEIFETIFEDHLQTDPDGLLLARDSNNLIRDHMGDFIEKHSYMLSNWKVFLESKKAIYGKYYVKKIGRTAAAYCGVCLKESDNLEDMSGIII